MDITHKSLDRKNTTDCGLNLQFNVEEVCWNEEGSTVEQNITTNDYLVTCENCIAKRKIQWSSFEIIWFFLPHSNDILQTLIGSKTIQITFKKYTSVIEAEDEMAAKKRLRSLNECSLWSVIEVTKNIENVESFIEENQGKYPHIVQINKL